MKKTKFALLLFVAFFFMGLQNVNAQLNLVDETEAITILSQEMTSIHDDLSNTSEKLTLHQTLSRQLSFYIAVYEEIMMGTDVEIAIQNNYANLLIGGSSSGFAQSAINNKDVSQNDQLYNDLISLLTE